jgi:hypothetical protein
MTKKINDLWRNFVRGKYQIILVEIIQLNIREYFKFLEQQQYIASIPESHIAYRKSMSTRDDLTEVSKIINTPIEFNIRYQDTKIKLKGVRYSIERILGDEYKIFKNQGLEDILRLEKFDQFLTAAQSLINARHFNSHVHKEKNDSGWALEVTASVMKIIELSVQGIDERKIIYLKQNAIDLLDTIIDLETYEDEDEDEDEDKEVSLDETNIDNEESHSKEEEEVSKETSIDMNYFNETLDNFQNSMENTVNETFNKINSSITDISNAFDVISKKVDESLDDKLKSKNSSLLQMDNNDTVFLRNVSEKNIDFSSDHFGESELINESIDSKLLEDPPLIVETDESVNEVIAMVSDRLNPFQVRRELLVLQKEFKKLYRCKNWENIAQGPFRQIVIDSRIDSKEKWYENSFILNRYLENQKIMDIQINSPLGSEYFSILERILWDDNLEPEIFPEL